MSDLLRGDPPVAPGGNGRAQNGGPTTSQGPVPLYTDPPRAVRTPTDVMRARRAREAQRRREQEAEQQQQQRRLQQEQAVVGVVEGQRRSGRVPSATDPEYSQDQIQRMGGQQQAPASGKGADRVPITHQPASATRPRPSDQGPIGASPQGAYVSGALPAGSNNRKNPVDSATSNPGNPDINADPASQNPPPPQLSAQQTGRSTFPHAFERWETLSSHWEGLTSYWIRRIQENTNELSSKPIDQQMARQITDLSAAGANLFHAVVELQRLRASSERKFQRWFFETRDEQERGREREAELEQQIRLEREERAKVNTTSLAAAEAARLKAEELVREMRRELQISKEEARRAWEELGRREQEERERTIALRSGEPTLIGGVQVVPMQGLPSRQASTAIRPTTRDGPYPGGPGPTTMGGMQTTQQGPSRSQTTTTTTLDSPGDEQRQFTYTQVEAHSPTETDPFTETGRGDPSAQYYATPQRPTQPATSSAAIAAARAAASASSSGRAYPQTTNSNTEDRRFYQQPGTETTLVNPISTTGPPHSSSLYPPPTRSATAGSEQPSYIPSTASGAGSSQGGDEEYEINPDGSYTRDAQGRRIPYGSSIGGGQFPRLGQEQHLDSDDGSDEYDVAADVARERQHLARYGGAQQITIPRTTAGNIPISSPQQPTAHQQRQQYGPVTVPPSTQSLAAAASQFTQSSQSGPVSPISPADYNGVAYGALGGDETGGGAGTEEWGNITATPRHRHPTRLSDILEERSGRTSPSRASYASASGAPDMPVPPTSGPYPSSRR